MNKILIQKPSDYLNYSHSTPTSSNRPHILSDVSAVSDQIKQDICFGKWNLGNQVFTSSQKSNNFSNIFFFESGDMRKILILLLVQNYRMFRDF